MKSQRNWISAFNKLSLSLISVFAALTAPSEPAFASENQGSTSAYELLNKKSDAIEAENHANGWAYIISGGVVLAVSTPGYYLSGDIFSKTVYSVTQTLSVASISYGSYLVLVDDDFTRFRRILSQTTNLKLSDKNKLSQLFLNENANRARSLRKIRVISHSLAGALNLANAITATDSNLSTALYFLGGVNALAALSAAFRKSEEEETASSTSTPSTSVEWSLGPVIGLAVHF
jgi:hypothetical protein